LLNPIQIACIGDKASKPVLSADTSGYCPQPGPKAGFSILDYNSRPTNNSDLWSKKR